jgi:hypothetical protein
MALGKLTDLELLYAPPRTRRDAAGRRRRSAFSHVVLRSFVGFNVFTGTVPSWIGSMAKLAELYAPLSCAGCGYCDAGVN